MLAHALIIDTLTPVETSQIACDMMFVRSQMLALGHLARNNALLLVG